MVTASKPMQWLTRSMLAVAIGAVSFSAHTALAQEPIVIKFSHVVAENTPKGGGAIRFAKLAEEKTKGRVKVIVYPNSQLYKDKEELEALQLGTVQMLAPSLAKFGPIGVREFELFDLPYMFDNYSELRKITDGALGRDLLKKLESKGILGLDYWDNGFKQFSAKVPLRKPEDFKGLKMRIQSSKVLEAQMRALGANPQVIAFGETYQALQTGVVDGTENPPSNLYTQKMHEVQKYVADSAHGYLGYAVVVNKKFWEGLPADIRGQLEQAMKEATEYANSLALKDNEDALKAVIASGKTEVIRLTPAEKKALRKALFPVHAEMAERIGADIIRRAYAETGFDPKSL